MASSQVVGKFTPSPFRVTARWVLTLQRHSEKRQRTLSLGATSGLGTMISDLKDLLASLSGGRPLVVALLVIAICFLLLRPRRKQPPPPAAASGAGSSSGAAGVPQQKLPALSLSTRDILLEFVNGAPQLKQERRPAQNGALALGGDRSRLSAHRGFWPSAAYRPGAAQAASGDTVQQTVPRPAPKPRAPPP